MGWRSPVSSLLLVLPLAAACDLGFDWGRDSSWDLRPTDCSKDTDCDPGLICDWGLCRAPRIGGTCSSDADCEPQEHCVAQISFWASEDFYFTCRARSCSCDADCPAGAVCDPDFFSGWFWSYSGGCVPRLECQDDGECAPGESCRVRFDAQCGEDRQRRTCELPACTCDADCGADQVCADYFGPYQEQCVVGRRCQDSSDCAAGEHCLFQALSKCADDDPPTRMCVGG